MTRLDSQGSKYHREAQRILQRLKLLIHLSKPTQQETERRAGMSRGYLSQILGGNVELKLQHLFRVLEALAIEPREFFSQVYPAHRFDAFRALEKLLVSGAEPSDRHLRLELARLYGFGIETVLELRSRLETCEAALLELENLGILPKRQDPSEVDDRFDDG